MIDLGPVADGVRGASRFSTQLINELGAGGGGFKTWRTDFLPEDASELADYIAGAVLSVGFGLQTAGAGLYDYGQWRTQQDNAMRSNMLLYKQPFGHSRDAMDEHELRLKLTERAVYVGCGSVFDALAACFVGILAIPLDVHKASFRDLRPKAPEHIPVKLEKMLLPAGSGGGKFQRSTLEALLATLERAGPAEWSEWLFGMRNIALHREERGETVSTDHTK